MDDLIFSVSDFVAVFNQTIEYAYPSVTIVGELANFRVSKKRWVYFDLKDDLASVKFFGTVYQLPGPLEDGLMIQVAGVPRLHPQFGFSLTAQSMRPVGEGSIKKAASLLQAKLQSEGLFDDVRKRSLPFPPKRIGLIASKESAAYLDFMKILGERWSGVEIELADIQVQGERAPGQIIAAIEYFNTHHKLVDVLVITRGGGSAEDLSAFNHEQLTRAVAASRIPTLVAIGHEIDVSLAELAADKRASTPSNAAQVLVPEKTEIQKKIASDKKLLLKLLEGSLNEAKSDLKENVENINTIVENKLYLLSQALNLSKKTLEILNPSLVYARGFASVRDSLTNKIISSAHSLSIDSQITINFADGSVDARVVDSDRQND